MNNCRCAGSCGLGKYLSPLSAWSLSLGCAVGWGAFVMPGTTFLPVAGPLGTLVGHVVAASRLLYALSRDGMICGAFGKLDRDGSPRSAIAAIIAVSCLVPFAGRTAVNWVVGVTTISASIAYAYVSLCTFAVARKEGRRFVMGSGIAGMVVSAAYLLYFLIPNFWVVDALSPESYFILSAWSVVGILVFRCAFNRDRRGRLGTSTAAWVVLFFFIFFSGHMWNRQKTRNLTDRTVAEIIERYVPVDRDGNVTAEEKETYAFLERQKEGVNDELTRYIVGFSQMLKLGFKAKEEHDEAVDSVLVSSKSLLSLVNSILDLSRRESDKAELNLLPTDCRELLREVEESFRIGAPKKGVEMRAAIGEMPSLLVDPLLLRHVVVNLVSNAVKFTENGFVEVRGRFDRDAGGETGTLAVEIEDSGVGISEEDKHKIDSPYMQTASKTSRNGGTGLGLAVCRQFAESMGGAMTFESELGKGSTFRITIPGVKAVESVKLKVESVECKDEESKPPETLNSQLPTLNSPTPRLLLVDDQKMNLAVLKALVRRVGGFEVETAADGREALARLQDGSAQKIDAVLTDMWMPELDGEGLAKAIRADAALAHIPVHVITADVELQEKYAEKGFDSIVLKPVTVGTLGPLLAGLAERKG